MSKFSAFAAALAVLAGPGLAHAEMGTVRVHLGDVNLSSSAGAKLALWRFHVAAAEFCEQPASYPQDRRYRQCYDALMAKLVAKLDAPLVNASYVAPAPIRLGRR